MFSTHFFENCQLETGIFRWNDEALKTNIQCGNNQPGSLDGFTGQPGQYQLAFDRHKIGIVATEKVQGDGVAGICSAADDGTIPKLIGGNDVGPRGKTYLQPGIPSLNVDLEGT